jgi:stage V sporulation protein T
MKATGIVRRIDDLGRIVIPKEIRRNIGLREGEPMELFLEDNCVCLKKYSPSDEDLAVSCHKYISDRGAYIKAISFTDGTTVVLFTNGSSAIVKRNSADDFDMNIALCYAFAQAGFTDENPVCE